MVRQRCFEIKCAGVSHVAHAEVQPLCQEGTENSGCDFKCIEGYTIALNTSKCKTVDFKTKLGTWTGNVSCTFKWCGVPPSLAKSLHTSVKRLYLDSVTYICKSGYSPNGLRYGKKELLLVCKSDGTYDVPHLHASQSIAFLKMRPLRRGLSFPVDICRVVHHWCCVLTIGRSINAERVILFLEFLIHLICSQ